MIKAQRKWHRNIWIAMTLTLPVLVIMAVMDTPGMKSSSDLIVQTDATGSILKEIDTKSVKVNIRGLGDTPAQLEMVVKVPLQAASAMVYLKSGQSLGQIGSRGVYRFPIKELPSAITIKDPIKGVELMTIEL